MYDRTSRHACARSDKLKCDCTIGNLTSITREFKANDENTLTYLVTDRNQFPLFRVKRKAPIPNFPKYLVSRINATLLNDKLVRARLFFFVFGFRCQTPFRSFRWNPWGHLVESKRSVIRLHSFGIQRGDYITVHSIVHEPFEPSKSDMSGPEDRFETFRWPHRHSGSVSVLVPTIGDVCSSHEHASFERAPAGNRKGFRPVNPAESMTAFEYRRREILA